MMNILTGWLLFPGIAFQIILALATAWVESALFGLFGYRRPMTPFRYFLHWVKGFAKRPVPIRMDWIMVHDILVIIVSGWLGLAIFSKHGMRFDLPLVAFVLTWDASKQRSLSIFDWIQPVILIAGFSVSGLYPGATFCTADVMQFQENYGPLIGTPAGALAALSTWIVLAFPSRRTVVTDGPYPGPISVLVSTLRRSGFLWLWTACFMGGSWHGLPGLRMILTWGVLVLSCALINLLPRLRERTHRRLVYWTGAAALVAMMLASLGINS